MSYSKPFQGDYAISSGYGTRTNPVTGKQEGHNGIDFEVPLNTPLYNLEPGVVVVAGVIDNYNKKSPNLGVGVKSDEDGNVHMYMHMNRIDVKMGQRLEVAQMIGLSGNTGQSTGPHLHFGIYTSLYNNTINPSFLLGVWKNPSEFITKPIQPPVNTQAKFIKVTEGGGLIQVAKDAGLPFENPTGVDNYQVLTDIAALNGAFAKWEDFHKTLFVGQSVRVRPEDVAPAPIVNKPVDSVVPVPVVVPIVTTPEPVIEEPVIVPITTTTTTITTNNIPDLKNIFKDKNSQEAVEEGVSFLKFFKGGERISLFSSVGLAVLSVITTIITADQYRKVLPPQILIFLIGAITISSMLLKLLYTLFKK